MKIKPTPAQENSLRKLLYGSCADRGQVISIHRPEMQEQMRSLVKAKENADKLFQILFSDLSRSSGEMKMHAGDQFWRRTTIRALASTIDGIIYCLKQTALTTGPMAGFEFTDDEKAFLSEQLRDPRDGKKVKFLPFRDNLKRTFKLFAKIFKIPCPTDFGQDGFEALCETYELRHRIIHPKSYMTFCVTDDEKVRAGEAIAWLDSEIRKLLDESSQSLGKQ